MAKITLGKLNEIAAKKDFFQTLDALRIYCGLSQRDCAKAMGIGHSLYSTQIKNKVYATFSLPAVEALVELFNSGESANAGAIIASLPTLRLKPLQDAKTAPELTRAIIEYTGIPGRDFKNISTCFVAPHQSTFTEKNIEAAREAVSIKFPRDKYPDLHQAFDLLLSIAPDYATDRKIIQRNIPTTEVMIKDNRIMVGRYTFSGNALVTETLQVETPAAVAAGKTPHNAFHFGNKFIVESAPDALSL